MKCFCLLIILSLDVLFNVRQDALARLPDSLSISEFGAMMKQFSEEAGHFPGENLVSNESAYLHVLPTVTELSRSGGVYIGVGTEQNFTYIAATRPEIAVIVDIRHDNMLQHLLYKALFEFSPDRTTFLKMLFGRKESAGEPALDDLPEDTVSIAEIVQFIESSTAIDSVIFDQYWTQIEVGLSRFGVENQKDLDRIQHIYQSFFDRQMSIRYSETKLGNSFQYPTFRDLISSKTLDGEYASFLASDDAYQFLRNMQRRNLIIPVVGSFSGEKTFKAIASYLDAHEGRISVFYASNVEYFLINHFFYVFQWYMDNVDALPIDENSLIIRSYLGVESHPKRIGRHLSTSTVHHIGTFIADYRRGAYNRSEPVWWRFWPWDAPFWSGGAHSYYHLVIMGDLCP